MTVAPLLCALLVASHAPAGGLAGGHAGTRVRGHDEAAEGASGPTRASSPRTRWASPCTYGETASDRAKQYNGRVYDAGTGFHDYGARLYWPEIGRFISTDSNMGRIENPASLNRYSYVWNNPYRYTDPSGNDPVATAAPWIYTLPPLISAAGVRALAVASGAIGAIASLVIPASTASWDGERFDTYTQSQTKAPPPNGGNAKPHGGEPHDQAIDKIIADLRADPTVRNIRKNQQQVDKIGNKRGPNRPDVQYDKGEGDEACHNCVEVDNRPQSGQDHADTIKGNDPDAKVTLTTP